MHRIQITPDINSNCGIALRYFVVKHREWEDQWDIFLAGKKKKAEKEAIKIEAFETFVNLFKIDFPEYAEYTVTTARTAPSENNVAKYHVILYTPVKS